MPPKKKGQKMALNEFLGDSALGSWADEMDSLPSAPSLKTNDGGGGDRLGMRGDSFRDRAQFPPREDLPLPTQPPYTAFVGNLAFDLTDTELEEFFSPLKTKSVKIIKDRDEKPKGFGYIEFEDLDGLKEALGRSGTSMAGRTIRLSVAEPPKERSGFGGGGGFEDDAKFDNPWRRDGPLPDAPSRDVSRRRFDGPPGDRPGPPVPVSDSIDQWRSSRPSPRIPPAGLDTPSLERKRPSFAPSGEPGLADTEEVWSKGSKFKPAEDGGGSRFGSMRRGDMPPPRDAPPTGAGEGEENWRASSRPSRFNSTSPSGSTPPTPQLNRRKLELLPRTSSSVAPSPLSSPRMGPSTSGTGAPRSNPFGDAKPVDVSAKEKAVTDRIDKDRDLGKDRVPLPHSMSRTSSRAGSERTQSKPGSPRLGSAAANAASVRPSISFANALGARKDSTEEASQTRDVDVAQVADQLKETNV